MAILIDARYIGDLLHQVRHNSHISTTDMARIFGVTTNMLHQYERGREIPPADIMEKIIRHGCYMILSRR